MSRRPEIDWLKGVAILFVFLIHAPVLDGTLFHIYVVNRAVPMFVVLFGMTADSWWSKQGNLNWGTCAVNWFNGRLRRLMPPAWSTVALWWVFAWLVGHDIGFHPGYILASLLGYAPWIGTFWFVTLLVELVVIFPLLRIVCDSLGTFLSLVLSASVVIFSHVFIWEILGVMRWLLQDTVPTKGLRAFYSFWIFVPQYLWLVVGGMAFVRINADKPVGLLVVMVVLFISSAVLHAKVSPVLPVMGSGIQRFMDLPLTIAAITALSLFPLPSLFSRGLAWCGVHSWGLYLGQLLIHNVADLLGIVPDPSSRVAQLCYLVGLLWGAVTLVYVGRVARSGSVARVVEN